MLNATYNYVLLKEIDKNTEDISNNGIIKASAKGSALAEVVAIGPDCKILKVGSTVVIPRHGAQEVTHEGFDYRVYKETDIALYK